MSNNAGRRSEPGRVLTRFVAGSGLVGLMSGAIAWLVISSQLAEEKVVVPKGAGRLSGRPVKGPLTAFEEANTIKRIALGATGGKTYGELEEGDPAADTALHASLLRASLFTSVLAYGVAALVMALGVVLMVVGTAMHRVLGRLPAPSGPSPA